MIMKPRLFVGSSRESLEVAYALQENLDHDAEVTVWNQGIFDLSRFTLDELVECLESFDYSAFIFAPDDIVRIRKVETSAVRDNVVFEFGLFVGRLGRERTFLLLPRGHEDIRLPTDLLGITPGLYEATRADGNLVAALGPVSNKIRRIITALGVLQKADSSASNAVRLIVGALIEDENDVVSLLESWLGSRPLVQNRQVIRFAEVDRELNLRPGATKQHIEEAAATWGYRVARRGAETIRFE